jgi:uracil-DNA glycosylase
MQFSLFDAQPKRYESFDALIEAMGQMKDDVLYPAGTNMVIYRGNPEARLMIVGEAPGTEEDRQGKPFVGRSGQLLDQMLRAVDLDPEKDVFISNAVFRMPPGDAGGRPLRKPTPEEIDYYRPYLLEIIRLVDPLVIVLSGGVAVQSLLNEKQGITKVRGTWHQWNGKWVMPIFHPAYLLRNPSKAPGSPKALTWQDIREIRRKYDDLVAGGS